MPEAGPHNPEYTQHHPNAITDRDKAELMAYATKNNEEGVVQHSKAANEALDVFADQSGKGQAREAERTLVRVQQEADHARQHRLAADTKADQTARLYESTQDTITRARLGISDPSIEVPTGKAASEDAGASEAPQQ